MCIILKNIFKFREENVCRIYKNSPDKTKEDELSKTNILLLLLANYRFFSNCAHLQSYWWK